MDLKNACTHKYSQLIFDKRAKANTMKQRSSFQQMVLNWTYTCEKKEKKRNPDTDLTPLTKTNAKWIPDLHVKRKTIKLLKDNVGKKPR